MKEKQTKPQKTNKPPQQKNYQPTNPGRALRRVLKEKKIIKSSSYHKRNIREERNKGS